LPGVKRRRQRCRMEGHLKAGSGCERRIVPEPLRWAPDRCSREPFLSLLQSRPLALTRSGDQSENDRHRSVANAGVNPLQPPRLQMAREPDTFAEKISGAVQPYTCSACAWGRDGCSILEALSCV